MVFQMVEAFVLVRVGFSETLNFMKSVKEKLFAVKSVKEIYGVFGRVDFVVRVETECKQQKLW